MDRPGSSARESDRTVLLNAGSSLWQVWPATGGP